MAAACSPLAVRSSIRVANASRYNRSQVWRSTDAGRTFQLVHDPADGSFLWQIVVAHDSVGRVYVTDVKKGLHIFDVDRSVRGGLVLGGSGYLGANKVAEDLDVKKWWKPTPEMERCIKTYLE